jgi:hypothetical protein
MLSLHMETKHEIVLIKGKNAGNAIRKIENNVMLSLHMDTNHASNVITNLKITVC